MASEVLPWLWAIERHVSRFVAIETERRSRWVHDEMQCFLSLLQKFRQSLEKLGFRIDDNVRGVLLDVAIVFRWSDGCELAR